MIVTMRDVAERAGVSITSVSHVVNKTRVVSDDLRRCVETAMSELGYQPNALARSLRRNESLTIGVIVPDSADPFYAEVVRGVEDTSFDQGYTIILCNSDGDLEKESLYTSVLTERRVDGILFFAASSESTSHIRALQGLRIPLVVVDRQAPDVKIDQVLIDNHLGGKLATQHLLDLDHRRIACISGPADLMLSAQRVAGYKEALTEAGVPIEETLIVTKEMYQYEAGYEAANELLAMADRPTAVFACNDVMAIATINVAWKLGWEVPKDLSVVGFDDIRLASFINPPLTTIAQPKYDMGAIATTMLLERIGNPQLPPRQQLLDIQLLNRRSTTLLTNG